jgi:hypothetical protein
MIGARAMTTSTEEARSVPAAVSHRIAQGTARPAERCGNALTIVLPIVSGREVSLEALLNEIGTHINSNSHIDFSRLATTHFCRWVVMPPMAAGKPCQLAFESNYDGTVEAHLTEFLKVAPVAMHAIYGSCAGYPVQRVPSASERGAIVAFLLKYALPYGAFYVAVPGASVQQIRMEAEIRQRLQMHMDRLSKSLTGDSDMLAICRDVLRELRSVPEHAAAIDAADDGASIQPLRLALGGILALAASPILLAGLLAIRLKESSDEEIAQLTIPDHALGLMAREDLQVQNQLTHVVPLRTGRLRSATLQVVLKAIDFLARTLFQSGSLGGITSIHFARWVLIDEGKRLLFFSNYDGSWESYLGDFIDKASAGLTAVWSNTQGFPKTFLLLFKGATDEERFKAWTRRYQVPTQLWYSAYPQLTVKNILRNRKICLQLQRGFRTREAAERWLMLL